MKSSSVIRQRLIVCEVGMRAVLELTRPRKRNLANDIGSASKAWFNHRPSRLAGAPAGSEVAVAIVFVGPSLWGFDRSRAPGIEFRPPAGCGDIARAVDEGPKVNGLIDGLFETSAAPWHKEIFWTMAQGVAVFGAASMARCGRGARGVRDARKRMGLRCIPRRSAGGRRRSRGPARPFRNRF